MQRLNQTRPDPVTPLDRPDASARAYPAHPAARDQWILARRSARLPADPDRPHGYFIEEEPNPAGVILRTATLLLTNRECPWRCLMCDLWKAALPDTVPVGAIPRQIDYALEKLLPSSGIDSEGSLGSAPPQQIKLYNSGSFFDPRAVPVEDYPAIAQRVWPFERVVVECHPALVGKVCLGFKACLAGAAEQASAPSASQLEVAMGLETVHPEVLKKLNKRMTTEQFARAADFLKANGIALRVFILVKPPFLDQAQALYWAERSLDFAFNAGATAVSLIPTRTGNGALEALQAAGQFSPPNLVTLELALAYGIGLRRGRVFADVWDLEKFSSCSHCFPQRLARLRSMNLEQRLLDPIPCHACGRTTTPGSTRL